MTAAVGPPPALSWRGWALDAAVMLASVGLALPYLLRDHPRPTAVDVLTVAAVSLPLLVRRVWPVPVYAVVTAVTATAVLLTPRPAISLAVLVALYTVAAARPRREALVAAAVLEVVVVLAAVRVQRGDWWYGSLFLTGMIAAALGLGLYAATRGAYLVELHDRAARLEREREHLGELAAAGERARIAREIHDIVAHHLTVMVALSDGAVAAGGASPDRAVEVMRTVSATGRRALADTRRLLGVLRDDSAGPDAGARQPVPDIGELDTLLADVRAAGLPVSYEVRGPVGELPDGVQLTVHRLVQEALTNTLKHGGPGARAHVRLRYEPDEITIDVQDDGIGGAGPGAPGRGLTGMRERVQAFGGEVRAGPRAPGGWQVSARLRLDEAPAR